MARRLQKSSTPMVVNMSLGEDVGTTAYTALDEAIETSIAAGVTYVAAAGNYGADASTVTPAHVPGVITVASHDVEAKFSWFSNHGSMIDIVAPGEGVISLAPGMSAPVSMSGTSMAAAHVTGAAGLFLALKPLATPEQVQDYLVSHAKQSVLYAPQSTTDRMVWVSDLAESDQFTNPTFDNEDGLETWAGPWIESGEVDGPTLGSVRVTSGTYCAEGNCLRVGEGDERKLQRKSVSRSVDLSGMEHATLDFDYHVWGPNGHGSARLQISKDGGASWTTLNTFVFASGDQSGSRMINISAMRAANAQIRVELVPTERHGRVSGYLYLDNVQIRDLDHGSATVTPIYDHLYPTYPVMY